MATLKTYTFLTLNDMKEWLRISLTDVKYDNILTHLINVATDRVEKYIGGPVITRRYVAESDGNNSNVVVPAFFPIRSIEEIRIDYARDFSVPTTVDPKNYILRGLPEMNNTSGNFTVSLRGQDIVLRSDSNSSILGQIFTGSALGAIRVTYTAGWGASLADLPSDLVHATMMLVEYLYILRENRELNLRGKSNTGQSYSREVGIPEEITTILDDYKDYTLGNANVPQRNTFGV